MAEATLAICICTMDRPDVLARCLASIAGGVRQPNQIIVSDDSTDSAETRRVCNNMPNVTYVEGPRRGLCANRNFVIAHSESMFVSLIDDDAIVSKDFVEQAMALVAKFSDNTIITGPIMERGHEIVPMNPSFWGHFAKPVKHEYRNINLNCNVFPRHAFSVANFDLAIKYGYEDMDLCAALIHNGYRIEFVPSLRNEHAPPSLDQRNQILRSRASNKARFYSSVKRHLIWERSIPLLIAYIVLAPVHRIGAAIKRRDWTDIPFSFIDMAWSIGIVLSSKKP